jgi:hypothetical protein
MFDIDIVRAGNKGLRPGVVAIEYIDWSLAHDLPFEMTCNNASACGRSGSVENVIVEHEIDGEGLTTIKKSAALPATAHLAGTPNLTL